jgi:hypothetical protein
MAMLAVLGYLKGHHKLSNKAGIWIIALILLGTVLVLAVNNF